MKIEGIEISHPDKIYFPDDNITKAQVVTYYQRISSHILPFLRDRPITMQRFPDGINEEGFYQKNASDYFLDFINRVRIETKDGHNEQVVCQSVKDLVYLVNQGVICFHIWQSRQDMLEQPDRIVFDLDPPEDSFDRVKEAAQKVRDFLDEKGIDPRLMTTGKSGLHVFYDKKRTQNFDEVKTEVRGFARQLSTKYPELLTTEIKKDKRRGRILVDYLRNVYGQTTVCPYSLRPVAGAPVATPIDWDELVKIDNSRHYHFRNIFRRLSHK